MTYLDHFKRGNYKSPVLFTGKWHTGWIFSPLRESCLLLWVMSAIVWAPSLVHLKDNVRMLQPRLCVTMSKRQLETNSFKIGPVFTAVNRRSAHPVQFIGAVVAAALHSVKSSYFCHWQVRIAQIESLTTLLHQTLQRNETLFFTFHCLCVSLFHLCVCVHCTVRKYSNLVTTPVLP